MKQQEKYQASDIQLSLQHLFEPPDAQTRQTLESAQFRRIQTELANKAALVLDERHRQAPPRGLGRALQIVTIRR